MVTKETRITEKDEINYLIGKYGEGLKEAGKKDSYHELFTDFHNEIGGYMKSLGKDERKEFAKELVEKAEKKFGEGALLGKIAAHYQEDETINIGIVSQKMKQELEKYQGKSEKIIKVKYGK